MMGDSQCKARMEPMASRGHSSMPLALLKEVIHGSLAEISKSVGLGRREGYVGTVAGWGLGKGEGRRRFLGGGRG